MNATIAELYSSIRKQVIPKSERSALSVAVIKSKRRMRAVEYVPYFVRS